MAYKEHTPNRDKSNNPAPSGAAVAARNLFNRFGSAPQAEVIRPASLFNLQVAAQALETGGIGGTLVIKIPTKAGAPLEVEYASERYGS